MSDFIEDLKIRSKKCIFIKMSKYDLLKICDNISIAIEDITDSKVKLRITGGPMFVDHILNNKRRES